MDVVMAVPGEVPATQVRLSWHSDTPECELKYMPAYLSPNWSECSVKVLKGTKEGCENYIDIEEKDKPYSYKAVLVDLFPDTEYVYKISDRETVSKDHVLFQKQKGTVYRFKTAGIDKCFNFGWFADIHLDPGERVKTKYLDWMTQKPCTDSILSNHCSSLQN
ncbi:MAG: fibronectin type III domain-containing protein [Lachnospiraceae bacterium]|nr:fibronectin type III domain-containing protein [Lachnospiraceae bacterium]